MANKNHGAPYEEFCSSILKGVFIKKKTGILGGSTSWNVDGNYFFKRHSLSVIVECKNKKAPVNKSTIASHALTTIDVNSNYLIFCIASGKINSGVVEFAASFGAPLCLLLRSKRINVKNLNLKNKIMSCPAYSNGNMGACNCFENLRHKYGKIQCSHPNLRIYLLVHSFKGGYSTRPDDTVVKELTDEALYLLQSPFGSQPGLVDGFINGSFLPMTAYGFG